MQDIELHDIKTIVEIDEYSLYYLLGSVFIAVLVVLALLYLLIRYIKNRNAYNVRREHYKLMTLQNLSKTKEAAYAITFYGLTFRDDSPRNFEMYENLTKRLEPYKYKKEVDAFDDEVKSYIELYRGMIDV
jgi:flagellar biosynthesis/type III secretory pathway M-ring protein FliF/YscJ